MNKNLIFSIEALDKIPGVFFWEKDTNSNLILCNEGFGKFIGGFKRPQDILGRNDSELFDDAICSVYHAQDREAILLKKPIKIFDVIYSKKMEKPKICITTKTPKFDEKNVPIGTFGLSIDATNIFSQFNQCLSRTHRCISQNSYRIGQDESKNIKLTSRKSECLFFFLRNRSAKETGRVLGLSPRTVEFYIKKIKEKFNSQSKGELFDKAVEYGFFNVIPETIFTKEMSIIVEDL